MRRQAKRQKNKEVNRLALIGFASLIVSVIGGAVYAVIGITAPTTITYTAQDGTTMQSFTTHMCAAMDTYGTQVLTDTRNSQNYRVRKMPDGRCWMIDSLKLSDFTLTSANSDVSANFTIPANPVQSGADRATNGTCVDNSLGITGTGNYLTCDGTTSDITGTPANTNFNFIAYSDPAQAGQGSYEDNCLSRNSISTDSLTACGYLYNWYTATAGTGTRDTGANVNASSSLCPLGWKLPTGTDSGQFAILNNAMATGVTTPDTTSSATTLPNWRYNGPFEGASSGTYSNGFIGMGDSFAYWSSTARSNTFSYSAYSNATLIHPGNFDNPPYKCNGYSIRCILAT